MCDGCGAFDPGRDEQREGMMPPEGWATVTGGLLASPLRHLCGECVATTLQGGNQRYRDMEA
jgi:hypothetical protein